MTAKQKGPAPSGQHVKVYSGLNWVHQVYIPDDLNNTLLPQGYIQVMAPHVGTMG